MLAEPAPVEPELLPTWLVVLAEPAPVEPELLPTWVEAVCAEPAPVEPVLLPSLSSGPLGLGSLLALLGLLLELLPFELLLVGALVPLLAVVPLLVWPPLEPPLPVPPPPLPVPPPPPMFCSFFAVELSWR